MQLRNPSSVWDARLNIKVVDAYFLILIKLPGLMRKAAVVDDNVDGWINLSRRGDGK